MATPQRTIRIDDETWDEWRELAAVTPRMTGVADLVRAAVEHYRTCALDPDTGPQPDVRRPRLDEAAPRSRRRERTDVKSPTALDRTDVTPIPKG